MGECGVAGRDELFGEVGGAFGSWGEGGDGGDVVVMDGGPCCCWGRREGGPSVVKVDGAGVGAEEEVVWIQGVDVGWRVGGDDGFGDYLAGGGRGAFYEGVGADCV